MVSYNVIAETPADISAWRKVQRARLLEARQAIPLDTFQVATTTIMRVAAEVVSCAGDGLIGKCPGDGHDVPRLLFQHLFHRELRDVDKAK